MSKIGIQSLPVSIPGLLHLRPLLHKDERGLFMESYRESIYTELGIKDNFVQDNLVHSGKNVFRGLHFQVPPFQQAKLITMISGEILDVVLDLRKNSETYLKTALFILHAEKQEQLYISQGFAHGYYVLSEHATISYKVSQPYSPKHQFGIHWASPELHLNEHFKLPLLSEQDRNLPELQNVLLRHKFLF